MNITNRLDYVNRTEKSGSLERLSTGIRDDVAFLSQLKESENSSPEGVNLQGRYGLLSLGYASLGSIAYALGYPIPFVRDAFANSGFACQKVFELRGTRDTFPVTIITIDNRYPDGDPRHVRQRPKDPPNTKDHSMTNSRGNIKGVYAALVGGEFGLASHLSSLAWDPPDAKWLAWNSVICTPNDQHLAYAVKHFFAGEIDQMEVELKRVRARPRQEPETEYIVGMWRAIVGGNDLQFREWLFDLLNWHEWEAKKHDPIAASNLYLSVPGVALATLAVKRGVISISQLPANNVYLPIELIELAQSGEHGVANFELQSFDLPIGSGE